MSENAKSLNRQGADILPEVWSMSLNKRLDKSGVGMKIVNRIYEKDTINIDGNSIADSIWMQ